MVKWVELKGSEWCLSFGEEKEQRMVEGLSDEKQAGKQKGSKESGFKRNGAWRQKKKEEQGRVRGVRMSSGEVETGEVG